jgi:hypothetical protein
MAFGQAISVVGALTHAESQTVRTISVNPTAIGNLVWLGIAVESITTTTMPTAVSGGHCVGLPGSGTWTLITSIRGPGSGGNLQLSMWAGVATATGAINATVTTTANTSTWVDITAQQLTCASVGALTAWSVDGAGASQINNTASTTVTWPSLTPGNSGSGYFGWAWINAGAATTSGQTAGYTALIDPLNSGFIYNTSVSGVQSPTSACTPAAKSTTMSTLFTAVNPGSPSQFLPFFGPGHHEDDLVQRSSGLYVQRRRIAGVRPDGGRDRVLVCS